MNKSEKMNLPMWVAPGPYLLEGLNTNGTDVHINLKHRDSGLLIAVDFEAVYFVSITQESFNFRRFKNDDYDFSSSFHSIRDSSLERKFHYDSYNAYIDHPPRHFLLTPISSYIDLISSEPDFRYVDGPRYTLG